jgi:hypothetical protein
MEIVLVAFVFAAAVAMTALWVLDLKDVRDLIWKHSLPETRAKFVPKVELRKPTPIRDRAAERAKQWDDDALYRAIRSGMPLDFPGDEHEVTLEIYRRVFLMVLEPMQKEWADAQEAQQAKVGLFTEHRGSGS